MVTAYDEFAGWGGSSQGLDVVPGLEVVFAANHNQLAVDVHELNFPHTRHLCRDITAEDEDKRNVERFPQVDFAWHSPSCPPWSNARGVRRDFDRSTQPSLFGDDPPPDMRRALMEEVPRYLRECARRGSPVLAGVVENVVECRLWDQWRRWLGEIRVLGYDVRLIALNSMHATGPVTGRVPQSRDRLYLTYWHHTLGRRPDWDKWLRPRAWCPSCATAVDAMQAWKRPGAEMGRYGRHGQYWYRCPNRACRHQILTPEVVPALAAIDLTNPGQRIGDRREVLKPNTLQRIEAGIRKLYRAPMLVPCGGTWNDDAAGLDRPMRTRTARETEALVVPVEGRPAVFARPASGPLRAQTARLQDALVVPPAFIAELRGGGSRYTARPVTEPLATFCAAGQHHMLIQHADPLLYAYDTGAVRPAAAGPLPTHTTVEGDAVLGPAPAVEDCRFRMLTPAEIGRGMAFRPGYRVLGSNRDQVAGYGRAVTPPVAEVLGCALVEAITGEPIERGAA